MGEALNSNGPQTKCTRYIEARQPDRPWSNDRKMLRSFYEILASIDYPQETCVRSHFVFHRNDEPPPTQRSDKSKREKGFFEILAPSPISYELGLFYYSYHFRNVKNSLRFRLPISPSNPSRLDLCFVDRGINFRGERRNLVRKIAAAAALFLFPFLRNYRKFLKRLYDR